MTWQRTTPAHPAKDSPDPQERWLIALADRADAITALIRYVTLLLVVAGVAGSLWFCGWAVAKAIRALT